MDLLAVLRTLLSRWYIVVPVLALTAAMAWRIAAKEQPEYQVNGTALMTTAGAVERANDDGDEVRVPAAEGLAIAPPVLRALLSDQQSIENLRGDHDADVVIEATDFAQMLQVRVTASTARAAVDAAGDVLTAVPSEVERVQVENGSIDPDVAVRARVVSTPASAEQVPDEQGGGFAATGTFVIASGGGAGNPYGASPQTGRIIQEEMRGTESRAIVAEEVGALVGYSITQQPRDTAPIMYIMVRGRDAEAVRAGFDATIAEMNRRLDERQANLNVPERARTIFDPLHIDDEAQLAESELLRPIMTIVALGGLAAVALAFVVEGLAVAQRRRHDGSPPTRQGGGFTDDVPTLAGTRSNKTQRAPMDDRAKSRGTQPESPRPGHQRA